jgi:hypothetical protein
VTYGNRSQDGRGLCLVVTANFCRGHDTSDNGGEGIEIKDKVVRNERVKEGRGVLTYMYRGGSSWMRSKHAM